MNKQWKSATTHELLKTLRVDSQKGLTEEQVKAHRARFGTNALMHLKSTPFWRLVFETVWQPMLLLLLGIALLSFLFGKILEAAMMAGVVCAYVLVELFNKFRSDKILARLKKLASPTATVLRSGKEHEIPTQDIVVGDILWLTAGSFIPADARLLRSSGLLVNQAALTGESQAVAKSIEQDAQVFAGTTVFDGQAVVLVLGVGRDTEYGQIAQQVQVSYMKPTILQHLMLKLSKILAIFAIFASIVISIMGYLQGLSGQQMLITWLALTFLMVPGQPPIIITLALALAAFELVQKKIIVKQLRGAEMLARVTAIVTDKTGTITQNKMTVEKFINSAGQEINPQHAAALSKSILPAIPSYHKDPTDKAIYQALSRFAQFSDQPDIYKGFSQGEPWRVLSYKLKEGNLHAIAGSPEVLIANSTLSDSAKKTITKFVEHEAALGKRIVAFAQKQSNSYDIAMNALEFIALAVLEDPVRPHIKQSIESLKKAGIKTYLVTGDHEDTTATVARTIGLSSRVITGAAFAQMTERQKISLLNAVHIFARVTPTQKLELVNLLKAKYEVVSTIGDGINDAPAIKAADLGIAMGKIGTDLAKEAADLVLTDDNFGHIPDAILIGRKAIDNFKKGHTYYLCAKLILLTIFVVPLLVRIPFPLAPIHIIIIELLMDLASSTIFVTEPAEPDLLERKPMPIESYLSFTLFRSLIYYGLPLAVGILMLFFVIYLTTGDLILAQTAALVTWLIGHILLALNLKQEHTPLLKQGMFSNRFGAFFLVGMIILSVLITRLPVLFAYFNTTFIYGSLWIVIIAVTIISTFWIELVKWRNAR